VVRNQPDLALSGEWRNQLGSVLWLRAGSDGRLDGRIESKVGGVEGSYPVTGFWQPGQEGERIVGFVVAWPLKHSVTSWSGRYQVGNGAMTATWILSEEGQGVNEWRATRIGYDTFVREQPSFSEEAAGVDEAERARTSPTSHLVA
jgi:hypothetical protein